MGLNTQPPCLLLVSATTPGLRVVVRF
uniref:Uncharacterized protein n=1 Tax=Arundo donax TaxID=35708 RepID=A0A0A8YZG7_ARUDO